MKTNIATDCSQSQRLLRCGVSADTADMFYTNYPNKPNDGIPYIGSIGIRKDLIPAWSLSALMTKVLPHNISVDKYNYKGATEYEVGCYFTGHRDKIAFNAPDPIEACVQLIEWLKENNYKLNEL